RSALPEQKRNMGRCGPVSKSAIAIIVPQMAQPAHVNHIEVFEAITIVIGDGHPSASVHQIRVSLSTACNRHHRTGHVYPSLRRRVSKTGRIEIGWKGGPRENKCVRGQDVVGGI